MKDIGLLHPPYRNGRHNTPRGTPVPSIVRSLDMSTATMRAMTPAEIRMARALGCCDELKASKKYRATVRALHASAISQRPSISDDLAGILRAGVRAMESHLPADVVELAGGAS